MNKMLTEKEKINYATGLIVSVAILNKYKDAKLNQVLATMDNLYLQRILLN